MLFASHLYDILKRQNCRDREKTTGCPGLGMGEALTAKGQHVTMVGAEGAVLCPDGDGGHGSIRMLKLLDLYPETG